MRLQGKQLSKALAAGDVDTVTAALFTTVPEAQLYITVGVNHSPYVHHCILPTWSECRACITVTLDNLYLLEILQLF